MTNHGRPCWFELSTSDVDGAQAFYERVFDWTTAPHGMEGIGDMDYRLAISDGDRVAGMTDLSMAPPGTPPHWLVYICVDDADEVARTAAARGGRVVHGPDDLAGVGRFAVLRDPQGAHLAILAPDMSGMSEAEVARAEAGAGAFDPDKAGHWRWLELMSPDPVAGFEFYAALFGWAKGDALDMGEMGKYQIFRRDGTEIGGMMGLGAAPVPVWLPYFGVNGVEDEAARITAAGGTVVHGPEEVPGGAFIAAAQDPQGAWFAIVGPRA